jgi:MOSC domain-containing protein YiiM
VPPFWIAGNEDHFVERRLAAQGFRPEPRSHDRNFQGAGDGSAPDAPPEYRWRPSGGPGGSRGRNKAVYAYPSEHYKFWRDEFPEQDLPWGMFGENLTTEGLTEENACIGDQYRIGEAVVAVTQPRMPCYKLGIRFGRADMVKRFLASRRSGIYFSVKEEGFVKAGDSIERIQQSESRISIADINRVYVYTRDNIPLLREIVRLEILPHGLHSEFAEALVQLDG